MSTAPRYHNLLETLFQNRGHGAVTLERFQFQLLYSLYRAFGLLISNPEWSTIQFEGIEDVDLRTSSGEYEYIQVKSSANAQGWAWFTRQGILGKFLEVYQVERTAHFRLVVDFDFVGDLQDFEQYLKDKPSQLPPRLRRNLDPVARNCNCSIEEIIELCNCITLERIDSSMLVVEINRAIIETLEVYTGNEDLYFLALLSRVYEFAKARKQINAQDLHATKIEIDEWISVGEQNPAINQGWIGKLVFEDDQRPANYYEGKGARPSHILGGLDAHRGMWIQQVHKELQSHQVCVVRASSGQGKSTLLFRYAYEFYERHTVLVIRDLRDDSQIEPVKRYIEALLKLNLPLLVLINDLADKTKNWHELVRQLTGKPVSFLIAARNENWFRYSANLEDIDWATVLPEMSFDEAQQIFDQFRHAGRIAPNIMSAAWAYEQVSEKKLLIEFVFLITQGQMLSERLEGQIKTIHQLQEDKAKSEILRLVSLAQVLDMSLSWETIAKNIDTQSDMQQLLLSMRDEYLTISTDGIIEGLHYVRSDHLISILHDGYPISKTIQVLLKDIPDDTLAEAAYLIYVNTKLEASYADTIQVLVERAKNDIRIAIAITQNLFRADERRYITVNQSIVDKFLAEFDPASLSILFVNSTVPIPQIDAFALIRSLNRIPEATLERMASFVEQMPERGTHETRFAEVFLNALMKELSETHLLAHLASVATLRMWASHLKVDTSIIERFIEAGAWHGELFSHPVADGASFMQLLYEKHPKVYDELWSENEAEVLRHFLHSTNTISISQNGSDIRIEFIVDETTNPHQQALERIELLRQWIPHFETYSSQGLYPVSPITRLGHDETTKSVPKDRLGKTEHGINRQYIEEIKSAYNTRLMYDYLAFWHEFRSAALEFVEALTNRFERLLSRRLLPTIQKEIDRLSAIIRNAPSLPDRFVNIFGLEHKKLENFRKEVNNFFITYLPNANSKKPDDTHVYRLNLFSAQGQLPDAQSAFEHIRGAEGVFFDRTIGDDRERGAYRALYETVECWLETPDNYALGKGVKSRDYVKTYVRKRTQHFQEQLQTALASAENYSSIIHLPNSYLEEPPLYNLAVGSDICSSPSENLSDALVAAVMLLSQLEFNYTYAYVIPLLNNQPVFGFAYRVRKDTVLKLSRGEIEVFHVPVTETMLNTIPSIAGMAVPETEIYISAQNLIVQLKGLRNEFAFADLRLKGNMPDYLEDIRNKITIRLTQIINSQRELLEGIIRIDTGSADEEWKNLWEYFIEETDRQKAIIFNIEGYIPEAPADDLELSGLYNAYLVRRYCINGVQHS
jgi:hypothetical protein